MKKLLFTVAVVLLCVAGNLQAQGFLYPTGPAGGPALSCPGCPAPRTSPSGDLGKVWPYQDPVAGFHRFLDSSWLNDWQQPFRTARAFKAIVAKTPHGDRIYMRIGSELAAYDPDTFFTRLANREELVAGAKRKDGEDLFLRPDTFFYAENAKSGWETPVTDGQERLYGFDVDDRGLVYLAYTHFGWGIVRDDGSSAGKLMASVVQVREGKLPDNIFVLKSNGKYYAFVGEAGAGEMQIFDVTDPSEPAFKGLLNWQPGTYAKSDTHFAVASGGKIDIYTNDGFIAKKPPIDSVSQSGTIYTSVASDGTLFYAAGRASDLSLVLTTIEASQTSVTEDSERYGPFSGAIEYHDGYLSVTGSEDVKLFKVTSSGPVEIPLNEWAKKYHHRPPTGYEISGRSRIKHSTPVKVGQKVYVVISAYSLGDVLEINSDDAISVEMVGRPTGEVFYGDRVGFVAKTSGNNKSVIWNFGNPEGADSNVANGLTGQTVQHTFSGITSAVPVQKTVFADAGDAEASLKVTLTPPAAAFSISGTSFLFSQPDASSAAPIVFGDMFSDESDGDSSGHYADWMIDGASSPKRPQELQPVGDCGVHSLAFTTYYGVVSGSGTPSVSGVPFIDTVSPFVYTVRPFAAAVNGPSGTGSTLSFTSGSRFSSQLGLSSANVTHQWDLVNASGTVIVPGPTTASWNLAKSSIVAGSRVRLKLTTAAALPGACAPFTESVAYSAPLNPPDPEIAGGCTSGGPPCSFTVSSASGQSVAGWQNPKWTVTPSTLVTPPSGTGLTFKPNFGTTGTYTVSFEATNAMGTGSDQVTQVVTVAGSTCKPMTNTTVFLDYTGPSSGCRPTSGNCFTTEQIKFTVGSVGYDWDCADHTFEWKVNGTVVATTKDMNRQLPSGNHTVSVTVSNGADTHTHSRSVKVGNSTPPPPDPDPNPGGSCNTMSNGNVFISYQQGSSGCSENNSQPCSTGSNVTLTANAALGYDFSCASHSFSWTIEGQTKTGRTINHAFASNGTKTVSVRISNGTQTFTRSTQITVTGDSTGPDPGECSELTQAKVFIEYQDGPQNCSHTGGQCNPLLPVTFTATADRLLGYDFACATHSFDWVFPGNVTKSGRQVQHTFGVNGTFTVKLTVGNGTKSVTVEREVKVGLDNPVQPELEISIHKEFLGNDRYRFTPIVQPAANASAVTKYVWSFGDGGSLTVPTARAVEYIYTSPCSDCNITLSLYDAQNRLVVPPAIEPLAGARRRGARH